MREVRKFSPTVSVLTVTYNHQQFLRQTIESVLSQTFKDWEMVIVDDGSTDATPEVVKPYLVDQRIRYIRQKHQGRPIARNRSLREANGRYIAVLDADDWFTPECLMKKVTHLQKYPDLVGVGSWTRLIDLVGQSMAERHYPETYPEIKRSIIRFNPFAHSALVLKRNILVKLGGYDESFPLAHDYELMLRVVAKYKVENLPEVLVFFRTSANFKFNTKGIVQRWHTSRARIKAIHRVGYFDYQHVRDFAIATILDFLPELMRRKIGFFYRRIFPARV